MILTIGPNPSSEKTISISNFQGGDIFRVQTPETIWLAGSKAFNFARALHILGSETQVITPLAGNIGQQVRQLAEQEGLNSDYFWFEGETRSILNIFDPESGQTTEVIENGPGWQESDWENFKQHVQQQWTEAHQWMVMCGSFLPGTPVEGPHQLVKEAHQVGIGSVCDTYGPPLAHLLEAKPYLIKINHREASDLLHQDIDTPAEALAASGLIQSYGPKSVVITLGKGGAVGVDDKGDIFGWLAPQVESLCPIGSGDAFLAGIMHGLEQGKTLREATQWGVAAGAANTLELGPGLFKLEMVKNLLEQVQAL